MKVITKPVFVRICRKITKPVFVRICRWRDFDGTIRQHAVFRNEVIWKSSWRYIKGARKIARQRECKS